MKRPEGKTTCNLAFIEAYMKASDECVRTGAPQPIKGFSGYKVSPVKKEDFDVPPE